MWSPVLKTETIDDVPTQLSWGIGWRSTMELYIHGENAIIEAGFPLACVAGEFGSISGFGQPEIYWARALIGWELPKRYPKPHRPFPTQPLWLGFTVNTLFFAALLWLPFPMQRWIRVRRGLCPKCAYPMGESAVCSECGAALPSPKVTAT